MPDSVLSGSLYEEQLDAELNATRNGVARYNHQAERTIERGHGASLKPAERLLQHWYSVYRFVVQREREEILAGEPAQNRTIYGPHFCHVSPSKMAVIAMHETLSHCLAEPAGVDLARLCEAVGKAVNAEAVLPKLRREGRGKHATESGQKRWRELTKTDRRELTPHAILRVAKKRNRDEGWGRRIHAHLGAVLIKLLTEYASANDYYEGAFEPAFETKIVHRQKNRNTKLLLLAPATARLIEEGHAVRKHLRPRYEPMLVEPQPWTSHRKGGYLKLRTSLVKRPGPLQKEELENADLSLVREGVNALQSVGWAVHEDNLDAIDAVWNAGGDPAFTIPYSKERPLPDLPPDMSTNPEAKKAWKRQAAAIHRANHNEGAERVEFHKKLATAHKYRGRTIYFPMQLDTRGRAYATPLHLNHLGDDVARGTLHFAEGKRLGESGLRWLMIHVASTYGLDKLPYHERIEHAKNLTPEDYVTADEKKRWQFRAAALDLAEAMKRDDPENHVSHIPVQIDGTANGYQHYSAIGRDPEGAEAVNLRPAERPNDLYEALLEQITPAIDSQRSESPAAAAMEGYLSRPVVKQPIMTTVYGVTQIGARRQIEEKLKAAGMPQEHIFQASQLLAKTTLHEMRHVCPAAAAIMDWLKTVAQRVTAHGHVMRWTTPVGLPVEQDYRRQSTQKIKTVMQSIELAKRNANDPPNVKKQVQAFAPNFIHGIDSSHLLMAARDCAQEGIDFAAVHDGYWTHAADVDTLQRITRESFIRLHTPNLLEQLRAELEHRFGIEVPAPPERGDWDLAEVRNADYMFS